jgi:hypothetical protein
MAWMVPFQVRDASQDTVLKIPTMSPTHQCHARTSYEIQSRSTGIPASTLWRSANNKLSIADKEADQQFLTPQEEQALVDLGVAVGRQRLPASSQVSTIARLDPRAPKILNFPDHRTHCELIVYYGCNS